MITVYRVTKKKHSNDPLSGNGGLLVGGRWHDRGVRIVYCAQTLSLASLEFFVHFGKRNKSLELVSFDIAIPLAIVERLEPKDLPPDWDAVPHASSTSSVGTRWLLAKRSAALKVPSIHSRAESTYLINPEHPDSALIRVLATHAHRYDSRMWN